MHAIDLQPGDTINGVRVDSVRRLGEDPVQKVVVTLHDADEPIVFEPDDEV